MASNSSPQLRKELGRIEHQYLRAQLSPEQKMLPDLVNSVTQDFLLPKLEGEFSDVAYAGSNYEYTTVPGKSDYDIQFYLKLRNSITVSDSEYAGWKKVRGGPPDLQSNGYLSASKARTFIQSKIDQALSSCNHTLRFGDAYAKFISRPVRGPALSLKVEWKGQTTNIDVVVCLKARDISYSCDLVAKPFRDEYGRNVDLWRMSYSLKEVAELRSYQERKRTLLRIMKVIVKQPQSQLAYFPSYFYKNILFMLDEKYPYASWGTQADLAERFKDMIQLICDCLSERKLPVHFNKSINYLRDKDESIMMQLANYLRDVISERRHVELLVRVPQR